MLKNLFGGKKDKYFRQIDEDRQNESTKAEAPAPAKEAPEKKVKPASSKKTSVKDNGKAAPAKTVAAAPAPAPKPAVSDPEAIIRAAVSKNTSNGKVDAKKVDFASTNAIAPTMSRRRPGPSLNMFKDMARQAKVPNK
jgi:hypothetical protein